MKNFILISAALLAAVPMSGQELSGPWSLGKCIDYALEHNISIKQSEITVKEKEINLNTAQSRKLPGVSGSMSENFSFGRGLTADNTYDNANTTSTAASLGADLPVFQGFQIKKNIEMCKLDLQSSTQDLEKARDDIRVSVAQAYVQILYNREIRDVAQAQVSLDSLQLERIEGMKSSGKASAAEVSAQQATLAQSRLSLVQADNNLRIARLDLSQLLELQSPEGFDVVVPSVENYEVSMLLNPEEIYAKAVEVKPAIKGENLRLDYAKKNIEYAKGAYYPTISLSGGLQSNFYTTSRSSSQSFGEQVKNNFSQYVGVYLSIPIFNRFSTRNSVRTANLNLINQEYQLESVRKSLYKEIQQAYYNAVASQSKYLSSGEAAKSAEQAFQLMREKYENGKANVTEYNESKTRWISAESDYLQARYECLYQTKLLDFYQGLDLNF